MRVLVSVVVLAVACFGCGGGSSPSPEPGSNASGSSQLPPPPVQPAASTTLPDACALLTDAEIAAALGAVGQRQAGDAPTQALSRCQWAGPAGQGMRFVTILIRQAQFGAPVLTNSFKSVPGIQSVAGIGSEAYANPGVDQPANNYRFLTMGVLTPTYYIQLDIAGPARADPQALEALTTAMRAAVARLPR